MTFIRHNGILEQLLVRVEVGTKEVVNNWKILYDCKHRLVHFLIVDGDASD